jgi:hypothetical protein
VFLQYQFYKMGTDKSCSAGNDYLHLPASFL